MAVDGTVVGSRIRLASAPYAVLAARADEARHAAIADGADFAVYANAADIATDATNVVGGTVSASVVEVAGNVVIDTSGNIDWVTLVNVPPQVLAADEDSFADLTNTCTPGTHPVFEPITGWVCRALEAGDIQRGTFDIGRIPTGRTETTVALGNHTHAPEDIAFPNGSLATFACNTDGQVPTWDGGSWTCGPGGFTAEDAVQAVIDAGYLPDSPLQRSPMVQFGTLDAGCDGKTDWYGATISFPYNFPGAPIVMVGIDETLNNNGATDVGTYLVGPNRMNVRCNNNSDALHWMAIEPGVHTIDGKMVQAGRVPTITTQGTVFYDEIFPELPVVLILGDDGLDRARLINTPSTGGFQVWVETANKPLYWIAMEPGRYTYGPYTWEAGRLQDPDNNDTFTFRAPFTTFPGVLYTIEDTNNSGGTRVRLIGINRSQHTIRIDNNATEWLHYVAFEIDR